MRHSRLQRRKSVEIFNFSFLDILACVIGLLIFILTVVVISGGIGSTSTKMAIKSPLRQSEDNLRAAKNLADEASKRRRAAEAWLQTISADAIDLSVGRDVVTEQIQQYDADTVSLHRDAARLNQDLTSAQTRLELTQTELIKLASVPAQEQALRNLIADSADIREKIDQIGTAIPVATDVTFHIPRLKESSKQALFVEVADDRLWCLTGENYEIIPQFPRGQEYNRKKGVSATEAADWSKKDVIIPQEILQATKADTVLTFLVRPDGYLGFREVRNWAWKNGYAVNWEPLQSGETINLVPAKHSWEQ